MVTQFMQEYDIVPTSLAVMAMRDNGYKNAAYALAELMDNSIQAGATTVELLCADQEIMVDQRARRRLYEVAVLDDGSGMDEATLQIALQFGNGSRLEAGKSGGMGRFGMGLPSASISQCIRVDVWSWQAGIQSALHSYIDLHEIERGDLKLVPAPKHEPIPDRWIQAAHAASFGDSGTLVVWSKIDRALWRTSKALIDNSEELIGRMYRDWIHDGRVRIRMKNFMEDRPRVSVEDREALPNDPLYLMDGTTCPAPFRRQADVSALSIARGLRDQDPDQVPGRGARGHHEACHCIRGSARSEITQVRAHTDGMQLETSVCRSFVPAVSSNSTPHGPPHTIPVSGGGASRSVSSLGWTSFSVCQTTSSLRATLPRQRRSIPPPW